MSFKNKLIWVTVFGILLGFVVKTEAAKRLTVGFEDYKLGQYGQFYDINQLQKNVDALQAKQAADQQAANLNNAN